MLKPIFLTFVLAALCLQLALCNHEEKKLVSEITKPLLKEATHDVIVKHSGNYNEKKSCCNRWCGGCNNRCYGGWNRGWCGGFNRGWCGGCFRGYYPFWGCGGPCGYYYPCCCYPYFKYPCCRPYNTWCSSFCNYYPRSNYNPWYRPGPKYSYNQGPYRNQCYGDYGPPPPNYYPPPPNYYPPSRYRGPSYDYDNPCDYYNYDYPSPCSHQRPSYEPPPPMPRPPKKPRDVVTQVVVYPGAIETHCDQRPRVVSIPKVIASPISQCSSYYNPKYSSRIISIPSNQRYC